MKVEERLELRDFRRGINRKASVASSLVPQNSVSHSINWNFDTIIGSAQVRLGTTLLGAAVAANKTPLGLFEFVTAGSSLNYLLSVFTGASTATIYYFNGSSWTASGVTNLSNTAKCRFAQLGNYAFRVNGVDAMGSSADGATWATTNCITTDSVVPSLIMRAKNRLLAGGDSVVNRNRVYLSSVVDPSTSPATITWNTNTSTGNWIDINPDDGADVTAFAETSGLTLIFKDKAMYRMDVVAKTVDTDNVFPFGAVSQECVVNCQGIVYFFTGKDIRRTNGGFPEQISRLGVQDWIDAISQANWASVSAGTDGFNVSFRIGNVTIPATGDDSRAFSNVVLKFSPRDESWSVHSYGSSFTRFAQYTSSADGRKMVGADTGGTVQTMDKGTTDNTVAINYEIETQELELGNRAHLKELADRLVVFMRYGQDSVILIREEQSDFKPVNMALDKRINYSSVLSARGRWFTFKVMGQVINQAPILEGFQCEKVMDKGIVV